MTDLPMADPIRVLVVDDHLLFADAVQALLGDTDDIDVIGVASSAEEAVDRCRSEAPDVVLMDLDFPGIDGIRATRSITQENPESRVLIVSASRGPEPIARSMEAGAVGYLPKTEAADRLLCAVRAVAAGEIVVPEEEAMDAVGALRQRRARRTSAGALARQLGRREIEILQLLADGQTVDEVAAQLFLSPLTVRDYLTKSMAKLGVHSRFEAVLTAVRDGLIEVRERID